MVLLVIGLFINLPVVSALQISNVHVEDITENSAVIAWETDEPADSFVEFGEDPDNLQSRGDISLVTDHKIAVSGLETQTNYVFKVRSGAVTDDAEGGFHNFQTLAPDVTAPQVIMNVPSFVQGNKVSFNGTVNEPVTLRLFRNDAFVLVKEVVGKMALIPFEFRDVALVENQLNVFRLDAEDANGNVVSVSSSTVSDTSRPRVTLEEIPAIIDEKSITLKGTVSENVSFDILVNNRSVVQGEGTVIEEEVRLEEGNNVITIVLVDVAGFTTEHVVEVVSDTRAPRLDAEIERGTEYYDATGGISTSRFTGAGKEEFLKSRASSPISGTTEPGAAVYVYVFRPLGTDHTPDFTKDALHKTVADVNGSFRFKDVQFTGSVTRPRAQVLGPREVPSDLIDVVIPVQQLAEQERNRYRVYLIAEDASGKTASWQRTITINSCSAGDLSFNVAPVARLQTPLRLTPRLLDEGREDIGAVFELDYLGQGLPKVDASGTVFEKGYRLINEPRVEPACTQAMIDDEKFGVGCKILPRHNDVLKAADDSHIYVQWKLSGAEKFSERDDDFWNDFEKRQLIFPLKVTIDYEERIGEDAKGNEQWSGRKTQTSCQDLSYLVDIPLESDELLPDLLANNAIDILNTTIVHIQTAREYVETATLITAYFAVGSFLGRIVARAIRVSTSTIEGYFGEGKRVVAKDDEPVCPVNQRGLYLKKTLDHWQKLAASSEDFKGKLPTNVQEAFKKGDAAINKITLDEQCPKTANTWKLEAGVEVAYRWTWDRAFCRAVPAKWTADKKDKEITKVILKQSQCAVTGRGIPLLKDENCQDTVKRNHYKLDATINQDDVQICWRRPGKGDSDTVYWFNPGSDVNKNKAYTDNKIYELTPVARVLGDIEPTKQPLLVYQPEPGANYIVGKSETCLQVCSDRRKPNYKPDTTYSYPANSGKKAVTSKVTPANIEGAASPKPDAATGSGAGCYSEQDVKGERRLVDKDGTLLGKRDQKKRYAAGYTSDCFVDVAHSEPQFMQCVCEGKEPGKKDVPPTAHEAVERGFDDGAVEEEEWFYHQERTWIESKKTRGTYYSKLRYYTGRDLSGAFGVDYLFDFGDKDVAKVDPHAGFTESLQTLCMSGILKYLTIAEGVLVGLQNCLVEAKHTGLHDAGACKAWFSQQVCGLVYKGIAAIQANSCVPNTFDDIGKSGFLEDTGAVVGAVGDGFVESMSSSIDDVKRDYGNAQLNNYFNAGAQGFAQSMCLAAFGFDFPLFSEEFLLDAAYAFPTHSTVLIGPNFRELSTFNPASQQSVHNYEVGVTIIPGCRIKRATASLKCIGQEDLNNHGIDTTCNGLGCDCLEADNIGPSAAQKELRLKPLNNLASGQVTSLPIETPQRVTSDYRYDHVKVELLLDPAEDPELCFDPEVRQGHKAVYYKPLLDTSPPFTASCQVDTLSGKFSCPELSELFGFGGASIEAPFITCYDSSNDNYVDCDTPNLFLEGNSIRVKVHLQLDGKAKCLKRTLSPNLPGLVENTPPVMIPENVHGRIAREDELGVVHPSMFGGGNDQVEIDKSASAEGCQDPKSSTRGSGTVRSGRSFVFKYSDAGSGNAILVVQDGVEVKDVDRFQIVVKDGKNVLVQNGEEKLSLETINQARFTFGGFTGVTGVLGNVELGKPGKTECTFKTTRRSSSSRGAGVKSFRVVYELLELDDGGSCTLAKQPVKASSGTARASDNVRIQLKASAAAAKDKLFQRLEKNDFTTLNKEAVAIMDLRENNLDNAIATYYFTVGWILRGEKEGNILNSATAVQNGVKYFFTGEWAGASRAAYGDDVRGEVEFQKIYAYMCAIDDQFWNSGDVEGEWLKRYCPALLSVASAPPGTAPTASTSASSTDPICGTTDRSLLKSFSMSAAVWEKHECLPESQGKQGSCLGYKKYVRGDDISKACKGAKLCCLPK
ncbi:hypothetical protein CL620_05545 [archaeon]|nr:hypothetical protein [archaeon]